MKRIFLLLTVFVMVFALSVPALAVGYNDHEFPILPEWDEVAYPYAYIGIRSDGVYALAVRNDIPKCSASGSVTGVSSSNGENWIYVNGAWELSTNFADNLKQREVVWTNFDLYYMDNVEEVGGTLYMSASEPVYEPCDGSSCPANDVNFDDICDDCGLPLAYNLRVTPNEYNIVVKHADGTTLKFNFTETLADTVLNAVYSDNRITVSFDNPVNHYQYKLIDGEWTDYASYPNIYDYHSINLPADATILSSDLNVYDENGDLFFRNPLWMEMEKVTQGEMMGMMQETLGTMKTLVVCGVGCLALLAVLKLFGKRSLIYRS